MLKQTHKSQGFTLLEILIALLIVSIGLLGVATLQIRGQQFNQVAYFRTQATFLAYDLMDRMRANENEARRGNYALDPIPSEVDQDCDESNTICSSNDLITYDLAKWLQLVQETLPAGGATIVANNNPATYTITIQWKNVVDGKSDEQEEQTWTLQL